MSRREAAAVGAPTDFPLHEAAEKGDLERVRLILRTYVDARNKDGCTPLYCAVGKNQLEIAETLLEWGADVNSQQELGYTPLHQACRHASAEMVNMLIRKGACIDGKSDCGATPLSCAAELNKLRIAELLIERGADVNSEQEHGYTPLLQACRHASAEMVKMLIRKGACVNVKSDCGDTPLSCAAEFNKLRIAELLIEMGADVNTADRDHFTPLHLAILEGADIELVKLLLAKGADVNAKETLHMATPLVMAVHEDKMEATELLLQFGADVNAAFADDITPLHLAFEKGHSSIAETLLGWGAYVNVETKKGRTPLDFADTDDVDLTIKRLVIKLKSANVHVSDELLRAISQDDEMTSFQGECNEEVERLKKEIVCSGPSYFDVLTKNATRLARLYAENEKFVPDLRQVDLDAKFPIYGRILSVRINTIFGRKESLERGYELFNVLPRLPQDCILEILDYLSSKDLMNCSEVCYI